MLTCLFCGAALTHDVMRFSVETPDGVVRLCLDCIEEFLARHRKAHETAGTWLEAWWESGR